MPFTPFHFGPGAALQAMAPRRVSFLAFCGTNVLIDVESLVNLVRGNDPVHAFCHTYVGATLVAGAVLAVFAGMRGSAWLRWLPDLFRWRGLTLQQVGVGSVLGAWTHVLLDSVMHADIRPLAPFSQANPLYLAIPLRELHWTCGILAGVGAAVAAARALRASHRGAR